MPNAFKRQVVRGLAWRSTVDIGQQVLQIIFTIILARLLTKADFGLVAMALLVTRFIRTITQIGFGTAIIQDQEINNDQVSAMFILHLGLNLAISILCFLSAPLAAEFFNESKLTPVIQVLAWTILISSLSFPNILLRKEMHFKGYSLLEIGSMISGNIVGITMAFTGFGVWALVWRLMVQRTIYSIGIWPISGWCPCKPCFKGTGQLLKFGLHMLGSNICYYFSQNMAAIITGKFIGVEMLGAFNIAYNLAIIPAQKIQSILTTVLTPAFSTIQNNIIDFRKKFQTSLFTLSLIYFPLMLGMAAVAQNLVVVIYGQKWKEAGLFLTFLAIVGLLKGVEHLLRSIIIAKGLSKIIFKITLIETGISIPLMFIGSFFYGVYGLICAYLMASITAFVLTTHYAQNAVSDKFFFFRATASSSLVSLLMFIIVIICYYFSPFTNSVTLLCQIILGMGVYITTRYLLFTPKEIEIVRRMPFINTIIKE